MVVVGESSGGVGGGSGAGGWGVRGTPDKSTALNSPHVVSLERTYNGTHRA
jgi:hypothetical protein